MAEALPEPPLLSLEELPGIAAIVDAEGNAVAGNLAFDALPLDPPPGAVPLAPGQRPLCRRSLLEAGSSSLRGGRDESFEMGESGPSGPVAWFHGTVVRLATAGPLALVQCTSTLAEKTREDRLARAERLLTDAQGIAHLGTWEWDVTANSVAWSTELFRIYGLTPEEYSPSYLGYLSKIHPDDRERVRDAMGMAMADKAPFSHDERVLRPDGTVRYLHTWGHPVLDASCRVVKLIGVCQDITDRVEAAEALRLSEERYRQIVETAEEGVWLIDVSAVTVFVNRKMAAMLGYEPGEMIGKDMYFFMDEKRREIARANLKRRQGGQREHHDFVLRRKDGSRICVQMAAAPLYDAKGAYSGAMAMVSDVTERRQSQLLLETQKNIFELLLRGWSLHNALEPLVRTLEELCEGLTGSILLLSEDGKRVRTGSAPGLPPAFNLAIDGLEIGPKAGSCGTAAFRKEPVICDDLETDELWADYRELVRRFGLKSCWSVPIMAGGEVLGTFALYGRRKRRPSETELRLVQAFGAAAALVIQHVRMRDSLAASELRFRVLADATSEGVGIHEKGRILFANARLAAMFGYELSELQGMHVLDLGAPESRAVLEEKVKARETVRYQGMARRKDGSLFWAEVQGWEAVFEGRPVRLASVRDLSEERQIAETRERLLNQEREARAEAERAIRVRDEFLAIASHELKTPLTPIKLELQLLRRYLKEAFTEPNPKAELMIRALNLGEDELDRLNQLISDLLSVTRISSGKLELSRRPCDLAEIVRKGVARVALQIERDRTEVTVEAPDSVPGTWDPARLDQIFTNLLTNALKYGRGAPVRVSLRDEKDKVVLSVRDHGIGIAPAEQERIFGRFVRVAPVENYGGLGLGLFIVRQLVQAHGGTVKVESAPGEGACFVVELPR